MSEIEILNDNFKNSEVLNSLIRSKLKTKLIFKERLSNILKIQSIKYIDDDCRVDFKFESINKMYTFCKNHSIFLNKLELNNLYLQYLIEE